MLLRHWPASLALWAALAGAAWGQPPTLEGPLAVPANTLVRVRLGGTFDAVVWSVDPEGVADFEATDGGKGLVFTGPAGTYRVEATYIGWEAKLFGKVKGTFAIGEAGPDPRPDPDPDPKPEPEPDPQPDPTPPVETGHLFVVYVSDVDSTDPKSGLIRGSATIGARLAALDAGWTAFDDTTRDPAAAAYLAFAKSVGMPCLAIVRPDGSVARKVVDPASEDVIVAEIRALRGLK